MGILAPDSKLGAFGGDVGGDVGVFEEGGGRGVGGDEIALTGDGSDILAIP